MKPMISLVLGGLILAQAGAAALPQPVNSPTPDQEPRQPAATQAACRHFQEIPSWGMQGTFNAVGQLVNCAEGQ